jgi:hypothetical protein
MSEDCITIVVGTDIARIKDESINYLTYEATIDYSGGGKININGTVDVLCSP